MAAWFERTVLGLPVGKAAFRPTTKLLLAANRNPVPHLLFDPHAVCERLTTWAGQARAAGRHARADELLWQAWVAYDTPARSARQP